MYSYSNITAIREFHIGISELCSSARSIVVLLDLLQLCVLHSTRRSACRRCRASASSCESAPSGTSSRRPPLCRVRWRSKPKRCSFPLGPGPNLMLCFRIASHRTRCAIEVLGCFHSLYMYTVYVVHAQALYCIEPLLLCYVMLCCCYCSCSGHVYISARTFIVRSYLCLCVSLWFSRIDLLCNPCPSLPPLPLPLSPLVPTRPTRQTSAPSVPETLQLAAISISCSSRTSRRFRRRLSQRLRLRLPTQAKSQRMSAGRRCSSLFRRTRTSSISSAAPDLRTPNCLRTCSSSRTRALATAAPSRLLRRWAPRCPRSRCSSAQPPLMWLVASTTCRCRRSLRAPSPSRRAPASSVGRPPTRDPCPPPLSNSRSEPISWRFIDTRLVL